MAGALALAAAASAEVKINGKKVMLSNKSVYQSDAGDLPLPPKLGAAPATGPKSGPAEYQNSFTCIPDRGSTAGAEKITIHGQYDMQSARTPRTAPRPGLKAR